MYVYIKYKREHAAVALVASFLLHGGASPAGMAVLLRLCYAKSAVSVVCSFSQRYVQMLFSVVCSFRMFHVQSSVCGMCST